MKKGIVKTLLLIILLLLAIVLGKIIGTATAGISYLSWLDVAAKFGFTPINLDLTVINLTIGAMINVNVAQAILLLASIIIYTRVKIKE